MTANGTEGRGGPGVFRRRLLLAVDAQGYGRSDAVTQREFQAGLARLLDAAAGTAGLDRDRWETQRAGDSVFAVLPEGTDEPALVDTFMRALDAGLRAFNRNRVPHARLRLRAAVHFGPASPGPNGFADRAPVEIHRILDSAPLREALAAAPDACLAVAVSAPVFHDTVGAEYTTVPAEAFRQVRVEQKEYRGDAWIWVPGSRAGQPAPVPDRPAAEEPRQVRPQPPTGPEPTGGAPVTRIRVRADEVAGDATVIRADRLEGTVEADAEVGRVAPGGTLVGLDLRSGGDAE
ncbi:hypothetical protein [Streptomyces zhihengii]|uniref:Guanylate cyclase domain-containing protein n=1 Tax=Streptomyces zhihengii TaxID=1818004 RepID=A0ABS2URU1_9ACTN|nr:hypothetical protein [Streptomyces zhihengii]MBM9620222.1 hypothetical protein [Streptomyces zhihengii]